MNDIKRTLLHALCELEQAAAAAQSGGTPPDLRAVLRRIDLLAGQLPASADPRLAHYLQHGSYQKARLHLEELRRAQRPEPAQP